MSSSFCECGRFLSDNHICPPSWQAIRADYCDPEDESTFYKAFGNDADDAAINLAERNFSNWEYPRYVEIWVRKLSTDPWQKFEVTAEAVPSFDAQPIEG